MSVATYKDDPFVGAFPETNAFWEAAASGTLLLPRCTCCNKTHWHPRAHCPFCGATELGWEQATGNGKVYSHSVIRKPESPYVLAYVQLDEGPMLLTNIINIEADKVHIGMPVQVAFRQEATGRYVPYFEPV